MSGNGMVGLDSRGRSSSGIPTVVCITCLTLFPLCWGQNTQKSRQGPLTYLGLLIIF